MLGILRKELVGNIVSFYELDEIMIKHGYQSELAWINDEGLWDDILKDKNKTLCFMPSAVSQTGFLCLIHFPPSAYRHELPQNLSK